MNTSHDGMPCRSFGCASILLLAISGALFAGEPVVITSIPITIMSVVPEPSRPLTALVQSSVTSLRVPTVLHVCGGDLNADGLVDAIDLGILLSSFGSSVDGDLNFDGFTDAVDLGILLSTFGVKCEQPTP